MICGVTNNYRWTYSASEAAEWTYTLNLTVPPTAEPVSLEEAKIVRRIDADDNSQDWVVQDAIIAAREFCERYLDRQLITATWELTCGRFPHHSRTNPCRSIYLPKAPLQTITSLNYLDWNSDLQTFASSNYTVVTPSYQQGRIDLNYGIPWPWPLVIPSAITITFVAGYGAPRAVPQTIKRAMHLLIGDFYENREPTKQTYDSVYNLLDSQAWGANF